MTSFDKPWAASSTNLARTTSRYGDVYRRARASSSSRSAAVSSIRYGLTLGIGGGTSATQHPRPDRQCWHKIRTSIYGAKDLGNSNDDKAKLAALKFLGHWIGDLHEPLHVSYEDDRGGGKVLTNGPCGVNLHAVWDGCIIVKKLGIDWRAVARDLAKDITASNRAAWTGTTVEVWASESFDIARQPQVAYCVREENSCVYEPGNATYDTGQTEKVVVVDDAYLERNAPIVAERLRKAGVRLGHLLNSSVGK